MMVGHYQAHFELYQVMIILLYGFIGLYFYFKGRTEDHKGNSMERKTILFSIGAFVWGDGIIGLYWVILAGTALFLGFVQHTITAWFFFCFMASGWWLIRVLGEAVYYFIQQFTPGVVRQPHEELPWWHEKLDPYVTWFKGQVYAQMIAASFPLAGLWYFGARLNIELFIHYVVDPYILPILRSL